MDDIGTVQKQNNGYTQGLGLSFTASRLTRVLNCLRYNPFQAHMPKLQDFSYVISQTMFWS